MRKDDLKFQLHFLGLFFFLPLMVGFILCHVFVAFVLHLNHFNHIKEKRFNFCGPLSLSS